MLSWLTGTTGPRPLGLARAVLGGAAAIRALVALPILTDLTRSETLLTPYVDWMPRPSLALVGLLAAVWLLSALLFMVGWRVSLSGSVLMLALIAVLGIDQQIYANHLYLMLWLVGLMVLADAGAGLAIRGRDRPVVRWPLALLMFQVSIVYVFAALTKINDDFLSGEILAGALRSGIVPFPGSLRTPGFLSVLAVVVIAIELSVGILIWLPRYRSFAFVLGLGLHIAIPLLMQPTGELIVFSLEMLALYPLFLNSAGLEVSAPTGYPLDRLTRYDLLRLITVVPARPAELTVRKQDVTSTGAEAQILLLEHLVPWLWLAPVLRWPLLRQIYRRMYTIRFSTERSKAHIGQ